jgi:hypothetical protein
MQKSAWTSRKAFAFLIKSLKVPIPPRAHLFSLERHIMGLDNHGEEAKRTMGDTSSGQ